MFNLRGDAVRLARPLLYRIYVKRLRALLSSAFAFLALCAPVFLVLSDYPVCNSLVIQHRQESVRFCDLARKTTLVACWKRLMIQPPTTISSSIPITGILHVSSPSHSFTPLHYNNSGKHSPKSPPQTFHRCPTRRDC